MVLSGLPVVSIHGAKRSTDISERRQDGRVDMRTGIVTGAATGIGLAIVKRLTRDGMTIAMLDRDAGALDEAAASVEEQGGRVRPYVADVTDGSRTAEVLDDLAAWAGPLDLLVNNAGIGIAADVLETSEEDWARILEVNLTAIYRTCRAALPAMIERGSGSIVNVSSVAGVVGVRNRAAYCASKAGVVGLTKAIAVDHAAQGIRANAICPGTVETTWVDRILADAPDSEAIRQRMAARQLDGRMGSPEEVADGAAFLATGRFMNGAALVMDGGMTAA